MDGEVKTKITIEITYISPTDHGSREIARRAEDFAKEMDDDYCVASDGDHVVVKKETEIVRPTTTEFEVVFDSRTGKPGDE